MKHIPTPNLEMKKSAIIAGLQNTYSLYKKAINRSFEFTWFDDNGNFCVLDGQEERNNKVIELKADLARLQYELEAVRNEIKENE